MDEHTILKCPSGHEHKLAEYHSYVKLDVMGADQAIILTCPGGKREHQFTLAKAAQSGMFTAEQAEKLRISAFRAKQIAQET